MNNTEFIRGFETLIEGLTIIKNSIAENTTTTTVVASTEKTANDVVEQIVEGVNIIKPNLTEADIKAMKYNEFKKFASTLGVKCTGTRDEIEERVFNELGINHFVPMPGADKLADLKNEVEEETDTTVETVVEDTDSTDVEVVSEFVIKAKEIAEETSVEDIIDALADVDIKATKKNYLEKLAYALESGLIEVEDDEDSNDEEDDTPLVEEVVAETAEAEDEEIEADSYFSQYDPKGYNDPKNMTDARAEAIEELMHSILSDIDEGTIDSDTVIDYINKYATEEEIELLGEDPEDEELIKMFMELSKRTVDDDGDVHEESDPYEVNGKDFCCGRELKYSSKTKKYICEHCGTEYEAE